MKNKYYKIIDLYFANDDIARNNANFVRSISNLEGIVLGELMGDYLLDVIYEGLPTKILDREGYIYHHQKYKISPYCIGLSAKDIAMFGLQSNSKNGIKAKPPKRLETLFMQCANLICLIAQEVSGATSLNDLSTIGAGYLYILEKQGKKYSDYELKNIWQEFLFNINLPFRTGNHSPFSNITLEFGKPNPHLAEEYVIYAGQVMNFKYKDIPSEYYDRIVNTFIDAMYEGDADGKPFTFPLITVNIYDNFDWNNKTFRKLLEKSEYFGGLYFQNYTTKPFNGDSEYKKLNPYLEPFDLGMIYSNCCLYPNTKIFIYDENDNVKEITLKELKEKYVGEIIMKNENEEWRKMKKDVYVPALNTKTGKIEKKKVLKFLTIKSNEKITVKAKNGFEFVCEPNHRIAIYDEKNKKVSWKFAKDLSKDDLLIIIDDFNKKELIGKGYKSIRIESIQYEKLEYFTEFMDIEVEDNETFVLANGIISFNCRMTFNIEDVLKYTGSNPFHSNSGIGGIGVININLNRILFLTKDNFEYFKTIFDYLFDISAKTLQRKREFIRRHWEDLYPYLSFYQKNDKSLFNIISIVGVHEGLINAGFKDGLKNEEGKKYAIVLAKYIRDKIEKAIEEYGELFNLEYAPSEYAGCKLAEKDLAFAKKVYDYLNGKKDNIFTEDEYLNNIIKEIVDKQGSKIFNVINL